MNHRRPVFARLESLGWGLALAAALTAGGAARASGSHDVNVSATVLSKNKCSFTNDGPTALAFGAIDAWSSADKTANATTTFKCVGSSAIASYFISSNDGLYSTGSDSPRMRHATTLTEFLPYTLNFPQSGNAPKNQQQTLTITGTVQPSGFANAAPGAYADTVTLTIAP